MGVLFTNNASTTLSAAISSTSATSISVASSSTFPSPGAGEYFYATIDDGTNIEIVKVTAVSGTTWTVVRASDNTSAATFANGTTIQLRTAAALLTDIQQNIAAKSANQTVYNATTASSATTYNVGTDPQNEANAMVFLDGVMQHHDTFSFSGSTLTFDAAPSNGLKLEVIIDNLINLQSSNLTVDTFTATNGQTAFTLSDTPAAEDNLIVFIEGVFQNQDSYSISTNTLTMSAGVTTNRKVVVYIINPVNIGTPSDGTVTSAKLSGNITTPGTLTVGSHDVAFDSPTFVVDNSNSRVGLGTASPSVPVDIVGDVKMSSTLDLTSHLDMPDSANVKLGTGDDLLLYHDGTNSYIANTTGALKIATETSGIAVTIGHTTSETTVADNLTVTGTITAGAATFNAGITATGTVTAASGLFQTERGSASAPTFTFSDDTDTGMYNVSNADLGFTVGGTDRLHIKASGNIGIGTTSPSSKLSVVGPTAASSPYTSDCIEIAPANHTTRTWELRYDDGGAVGNGFSISAAHTRILYLNANGKVGIGTASPDSMLHLYKATGSGALEPELKIENNHNTSSVTDGAGRLTFYSDDSNNSGIPDNAWLGQVRFMGDDKDGSATEFEYAYMVGLARDPGSGSTRKGGLSFYTRDGNSITETVTITENKLGVGTTSPSGRFHVWDGSAADAFTVESYNRGAIWNSVGANGMYSEYQLQGTAKFRMGQGNHLVSGGSASNFAFQASAGDLLFSTSTTERMRLLNDGGLCIARTSQFSPASKLVVSAGADGGTTPAASFQANTSTSSGSIVVWYKGNGGEVGAVGMSNLNAGSTVTYGGTSDYRLKENVDYTWNATTRLKQLKPARFNWIEDDTNTLQDGFLAHEVENIVPEAVMGQKDAVKEDDSIKPQMMDNAKLVPLLVKTIQELEARIKTLEDA